MDRLFCYLKKEVNANGREFWLKDIFSFWIMLNLKEKARINLKTKKFPLALTMKNIIIDKCLTLSN